MSRRKLPPRLYLDATRNEWVVRHGEKFKRTGHGPADKEKAQAILVRYTNLWQSKRTIYFITCLQEGFPIKIGSAVDLTGRLSNLATALPWQPVLLASFSGERVDETKLHARFSEFRMRGEWFRRVDQILEYAASIRAFDGLDAPRAIVPISVPSELTD